MRKLLPVFLLLALAAPALPQTLPGPLLLLQPEALAALQRDLASEDFATRDRAQALLDSAPVAARDTLAALADATTDPEAQSRLKVRVEALDDIRATTVPGISLDLQQATLPQVAAALAQATGQPFTADSGAAAERFTLNAHDLPFWEIQRQLNLQHPIWFNVGVNDIRVNRSSQSWRDASMIRGLAVFIQDLKAPLPGRAGAVPDSKFTTTLGLGIDPRICILQLKPPEFGVVTDELKNRWNVTAASAAVSTISLGRGITFSRPITLTPALMAGATRGKTIPSLCGVFPIVVQSAVQTRTFDPAKDALAVPFTMGNVEISVTKCTVTGGDGGGNANVAFDLIVHPVAGKDGEVAFPVGPVAISILDAAGKTVIVRTLPLGFIGSMSNGFSLPATGPLTMRLDVTTAVREVKIPFAFEDVPLP